MGQHLASSASCCILSGSNSGSRNHRHTLRGPGVLIAVDSTSRHVRTGHRVHWWMHRHSGVHPRPTSQQHPQVLKPHIQTTKFPTLWGTYVEVRRVVHAFRVLLRPSRIP
eukprot:838033-Rhodomonas_salina.2